MSIISTDQIISLNCFIKLHNKRLAGVSHLSHSVLKNLPMSIHVFFFWIQIYMATDFKSVCGRRSIVGHLIKTKTGKMFLQQSSKGENSTKREMKQNDYAEVKIISGANKKQRWGRGDGRRPPILV